MSLFKCGICWAVIIAFSALNLGCGAMFGGSNQNIRLASQPSGAQVTVDKTGLSHTTPTIISLPRSDTYILTFEKEGYESKKVSLQKNIRGGILFLDILTGLIGVIVDAVTGSWYKLTPEQVDVTLTKTSASIEGPDEIHISLAISPAVRKGVENDEELRVNSSLPVTVKVEAVK